MEQAPKRTWRELVESSNGQMVFLPESLLESATKWSAERDAFNAKINEISQMENSLKKSFVNLMYDIQKHYADAGRPEIWGMDVGFNTEALKEKVFILNITEPRK